MKFTSRADNERQVEPEISIPHFYKVKFQQDNVFDYLQVAAEVENKRVLYKILHSSTSNTTKYISSISTEVVQAQSIHSPVQVSQPNNH